jgi:hypothetical protein
MLNTITFDPQIANIIVAEPKGLMPLIPKPTLKHDPYPFPYESL